MHIDQKNHLSKSEGENNSFFSKFASLITCCTVIKDEAEIKLPPKKSMSVKSFKHYIENSIQISDGVIEREISYSNNDEIIQNEKPGTENNNIHELTKINKNGSPEEKKFFEKIKELIEWDDCFNTVIQLHKLIHSNMNDIFFQNVMVDFLNSYRSEKTVEDESRPYIKLKKDVMVEIIENYFYIEKNDGIITGIKTKNIEKKQIQAMMKKLKNLRGISQQKKYEYRHSKSAYVINNEDINKAINEVLNEEINDKKIHLKYLNLQFHKCLKQPVDCILPFRAKFLLYEIFKKSDLTLDENYSFLLDKISHKSYLKENIIETNIYEFYDKMNNIYNDQLKQFYASFPGDAKYGSVISFALGASLDIEFNPDYISTVSKNICLNCDACPAPASIKNKNTLFFNMINVHELNESILVDNFNRMYENGIKIIVNDAISGNTIAYKFYKALLNSRYATAFKKENKIRVIYNWIFIKEKGYRLYLFDTPPYGKAFSMETKLKRPEEFWHDARLLFTNDDKVDNINDVFNEIINIDNPKEMREQLAIFIEKNLNSDDLLDNINFQLKNVQGTSIKHFYEFLVVVGKFYTLDLNRDGYGNYSPVAHHKKEKKS